ncbi:hypothetical protein CBS101457_006888 [Exobasidium rhododendri]|nr:hypothetical protein CBS101457_006888 [Exobasidium rhododendri]
MGILASGAGVGSTVLPIMVRRLIPAVGFPWTMRIIAFASLAFLCPSYFLIKTRLPPIKLESSRSFVDLSAFKMKSFTFFVIGAAMIMCE